MIFNIIKSIMNFFFKDKEEKKEESDDIEQLMLGIIEQAEAQNVDMDNFLFENMIEEAIMQGAVDSVIIDEDLDILELEDETLVANYFKTKHNGASSIGKNRRKGKNNLTDLLEKLNKNKQLGEKIAIEAAIAVSQSFLRESARLREKLKSNPDKNKIAKLERLVSITDKIAGKIVKEPNSMRMGIRLNRVIKDAQITHRQMRESRVKKMGGAAFNAARGIMRSGCALMLPDRWRNLALKRMQEEKQVAKGGSRQAINELDQKAMQISSRAQKLFTGKSLDSSQEFQQKLFAERNIPAEKKLGFSASDMNMYNKK